MAISGRSRIMDDNSMLRESHQFALPQFPENAVDVNGAEPERVGQNILIERAFELISRGQPDHRQAIVELQEEMRSPLDGATATNADEMLHDHRLVARRRPENGCEELRIVFEHLFQARRFNTADDGIGQGRKRVIRCPQQHAAQSDAVATNWERDDLSSAIG